MTDTTHANTTTETTASAPRSVDTRTVEWRPDHHTRKKALARVTPTAVVLQHIRTVDLVNLGPASTCEIDTEATVEDLPDEVAAKLGVTPCR
ncbi:hypothetical protein [Haloplanus natans]|uniref:hypothetical protein n=1 Tax=Haloplanus natans TaxID=376171 RepID=UPI000677F96D|nr:hypothetical protein [Haloplanus natans]